MIVKEFPHIEMDGILKYLYDKNHSYYEYDIKYTSSGYYDNYYQRYAFDFDSSTFWLSSITSQENFLSFCFIKFKAELIGYELKSSSGGARGKKWEFSGSDDNVIWHDTQQTEYSLKKNEVYFVDWRKKAYKCFKLTCLGNQQDSYLNFDLAQIEIFGKIVKENQKTCKRVLHKYSFSLSDSLMIFLISMK